MSYARFGSPMQELGGLGNYLKWHAERQALIAELEKTDPDNWRDNLPEHYQGSSVYVYLDWSGYLCCYRCSLGGQWHFYTTGEIIAHLEEHRKVGDRVPNPCIDRLEADREVNDKWIAGFVAGGER